MVSSVKDRGRCRFGQLLRWAPREHPVSQPQRVRAAVGRRAGQPNQDLASDPKGTVTRMLS